jgi:hypothetical protein
MLFNSARAADIPTRALIALGELIEYVLPRLHGLLFFSEANAHSSLRCCCPYHATCWRLFNKTQSFSRRRRRPGGEMESWLFISGGLHKDKRCSRVQSRPRQNCFCNAGTLVLHGIGLIEPSLYIIMSGSGRPSAKVPVTKVYMSFRSKNKICLSF